MGHRLGTSRFPGHHLADRHMAQGVRLGIDNRAQRVSASIGVMW
jgi:hypothetical protein